MSVVVLWRHHPKKKKKSPDKILPLNKVINHVIISFMESTVWKLITDWIRVMIIWAFPLAMKKEASNVERYASSKTTS